MNGDMLCVVDKQQIEPGDRLLLEQCGELAEVELHAEVGLRTWAGVLRDAQGGISVPLLDHGSGQSALI
jgi:hypothetical protein